MLWARFQMSGTLEYASRMTAFFVLSLQTEPCRHRRRSPRNLEAGQLLIFVWLTIKCNSRVLEVQITFLLWSSDVKQWYRLLFIFANLGNVIAELLIRKIITHNPLKSSTNQRCYCGNRNPAIEQWLPTPMKLDKKQKNTLAYLKLVLSIEEDFEECNQTVDHSHWLP